MKAVKISYLVVLLLVTLSLQAQEEPQIANWGAFAKAGLSMGFAKDWVVAETPEALAGTTPDGQVAIVTYIAEGNEVQAVINNLQAELDKYFENLTLLPLESYELNGLNLLKTSGVGKLKDQNHFNMEIHVDVLETPLEGDNAVVLVVTYGAEEAISQYFGEILLTLNSFKKD